MKKLLLCLLSFSLLSIAHAQLGNGSFESWSTTGYDEPTGWQTGNKEALSLGLTPVTKVTGTSGFAVRMETLVSNGDTAQAFIANGDPMSGDGGMPFTQQPTAITGYYRYHLQGNDTALILVEFKKNGQIFSSDIFKIRGTGTQNTFTGFSFPLSLAIAPDTVIIAATSSNLIDNVGVAGGSFLELDGIAFTGANTPIDNGAFENWSTHTNDIISGWESYGEVSKTTDSYDGTYALSMMTADYGNGQIGSAGLTNGHNTNNGPTGGTPYTLTTDTLTGYYKYSTSGNDSASINISLLQNSNYLFGGNKFLPPVSQYTYFEIAINSMNIPDTMRIDIQSSKWPYSPSSAGSTLLIDHLQFKSELTAGVGGGKQNISFAYPNPARESLHIHLGNNIAGKVMMEIYDLNGRQIVKENKYISESELNVEISGLAQGRYYYKVSNGSVQYQQMFTKQ